MRKTAGMMLALGMVLAASGCAPSHKVWVKRGVSMTQAVGDLKDCAERTGLRFEPRGKGGGEAFSSEVTYAASKFDSCMTDRKFRRKK